jgi:hypothetical protein
MADNETTADIIAEMRRRSDEAYKGSFNYPECQENQIEYDEASEWASRLEAAHKRELSKNASKNGADFGQLGDAAKLREALGKLRAELWNNTVIAGKRKFELYEIADAALDAPPRNCDKYPTFNDAIRALADKRGWHDAKWDSERYCILASWLYAPYEEGGNDGNE